jgi:Na+/H+-dicarboxylate symporter
MIKLNVFSCICAFVTNRRVTGGHPRPGSCTTQKNIISVFKKLSKEQRRAFPTQSSQSISTRLYTQREATKIYLYKKKLKHPRRTYVFSITF